MNYQPIENYGVIGDLTTTALVGMNGSIDFMCFPAFDSPTIFAALLDCKRGGHFQISRRRMASSNIASVIFPTRIFCSRVFSAKTASRKFPISWRCSIWATATISSAASKSFAAKSNFGWFARRNSITRASATPSKKNRAKFFSFPPQKKFPALRLRSSVLLKTENGEATAEFKLRTDESAWFILEEADGESPSENPDYVSEAFKETMNFWLAWVAHSNYRGRWREMVNRSALTLKLLTSLPHGSIVAAPTFGLPESIGGARNWDYRYTWIRDASFTLYALMRLGYTEEAQAFMHWMEQRCRELAARTTAASDVSPRWRT